jgi:RNA polymerase sigma-70 factor (ECF subfamily)
MTLSETSKLVNDAPDAPEAAEAGVIAKAVAGDQRSFERLIARWDGEILNLAYRLTGSREDAHDVRQEAFIRAYRALARFDGRCRFSTWMFGIVVNLCRDRHRSLAARRRLLEGVALERPAGEAGCPDDPALAGEMREVVRSAVMNLPPDEREVLVLRHYHQMPLSDVAALLGVPSTTARSRMNRALGRMRESLVRADADSRHESGGACGDRQERQE